MFDEMSDQLINKNYLKSTKEKGIRVIKKERGIKIKSSHILTKWRLSGKGNQQNNPKYLFC